MEYEIIRSRRKIVSLEVTGDLKILVRSPLKYPERDIEKFVEAHSEWIKRKLELQQKRQTLPINRELSAQEAALLKEQAERYFLQRTEYFSAITALTPQGIKITNAKTRFGSCSTKNVICYSLRLMLYPQFASDYVIMHELAHIRHKNHGKEFYSLIEKYMPDYRSRIKALKGGF